MYHGTALAGEDRHKTTFGTEWGKFRYKRAPQGYQGTATAGTQTPSWKTVHQPGLQEDCGRHHYVEGAFQRICSILSHCNKNGLVFNSQKFRFTRREVELAGFLNTEDGINSAAKYTAAVRDFPTLRNISEVRSCYGHLLSPNTPFEWTVELEEAFAASKEKIIEVWSGFYSRRRVNARRSPQRAALMDGDWSWLVVPSASQQKGTTNETWQSQ